MLIGIIGFFAGIIGGMGMGGGTILINTIRKYRPQNRPKYKPTIFNPNDDSSPCNTYKKEKCRF